MRTIFRSFSVQSVIVAGASYAALLVAPAAVAADTAQEIKDTVQQTAYEIADKDNLTIKFAKGSANLSDSAVSELKNTFNAVREDAKVKEILIVSYSDQNYPKNQKDSLSKADRQLADKRIDAIKAKLKDFGASNIKTYNMAEKSNWFEKTLVTSDAQIKREASEKPAKEDRDDAFYQVLGRHLMQKGGASTAFVIVRRDYVYSH